MKTQKKGFAKFLKNFAVMSLLTMTIISCGDNNRSGGNIGIGGINPNTGIINYGIAGIDNSIGVIAQFMPCQTVQQFPGQVPLQQVAGNRIRSQVQVPQNGGLYLAKPVIGITVEGDIAVLYSNGNQALMDVYACQRPDLVNNQAQLYNIANPIQEVYCPVDGLVADVGIQGQFGQYILKFFPITANGQIASQICR